eukprot:2908593-Pleurochrysis_carterae.AAC.1
MPLAVVAQRRPMPVAPVKRRAGAPKKHAVVCLHKRARCVHVRFRTWVKHRNYPLRGLGGGGGGYTPRRSGARGAVERSARLRVLEEQLRRRELVAVLLLQHAQLLDDGFRAKLVHVHEGPAQKRRETDAKDGADVAVARVADDARLEAVDRLDQEAQHHPLGQLGLGERVRLLGR